MQSINSQRLFFFLAAALISLSPISSSTISSSAVGQDNLLPSWKAGASKKAIIEFVEQVTDSNSKHFVPVSKRIAVFDNDGTLWCEKPMYAQLAFALDRVKELAPQYPEWKEKLPFKAVLENDLKQVMAGGHKALAELVMASHAGTTTDEFEEVTRKWLDSARHPETGKPYTGMVYQPMLELLNYLRKNGFETWIVSGGGIEFIRPWSKQVYGIPPQQVIGSTIETKFEIRNGKPVLVRLPRLDFVDDKEGKPVAINRHIGVRPIAAFGNSDGDIQMLQWATSGQGKTLGMIIHHTDAQREYSYDRESSVGRLDQGFDLAKQNGWTIVDMKKDWAVVFPGEASK